MTKNNIQKSEDQRIIELELAIPKLMADVESLGKLEPQVELLQDDMFTKVSREVLADTIDQLSLNWSLFAGQVDRTVELKDLASKELFFELLKAPAEGTGCKTKGCMVEVQIIKITLDRDGRVKKFRVKVTTAGCALAIGAEFDYQSPPKRLSDDIKFWRRNNTKIKIKFDDKCKIETIEE